MYMGIEIQNSKTLGCDAIGDSVTVPRPCVVATFFSLSFHYLKEQV
jgi:hypothetical protein